MAIEDRRDDTMYVPAWQGLTLGGFIARPSGRLAPFPFRAAHRTAFHTARSAIYHLFVQLVQWGRGRVLAPDYHMGNELRAIRAAGAQVELYDIGRDAERWKLEWTSHTRSHPWLFIFPNRARIVAPLQIHSASTNSPTSVVSLRQGGRRSYRTALA
jgi:hypothetical protein